MEIKYSFNTSTKQQISDHLWRMDRDFMPPLHTYVDIDQYSQKLAANAVRIESYMGSKLVGLIATYYNRDKMFLYVSNISIEKDFRGKGIELSRGLVNFLAGDQDLAGYSPKTRKIANDWLKELTNDAKPAKLIIKSIHTEVRNANRKALLFYRRLGFNEVKTEMQSTYLIKEL